MLGFFKKVHILVVIAISKKLIKKLTQSKNVWGLEGDMEYENHR